MLWGLGRQGNQPGEQPPLRTCLNSQPSTGKGSGAPPSHTQAHPRGPQSSRVAPRVAPFPSSAVSMGPSHHATHESPALPASACARLVSSRHVQAPSPLLSSRCPCGHQDWGTQCGGCPARVWPGASQFWKVLGSEQTCSTHTLTLTLLCRLRGYFELAWMPPSLPARGCARLLSEPLHRGADFCF